MLFFDNRKSFDRELVSLCRREKTVPGVRRLAAQIDPPRSVRVAAGVFCRVRMRVFVSVAEAFGTDMRVDLSGGEAFMT